MKKILPLLVAASLSTISCEDDIIYYELGLMRGDWLEAKTVITNGDDPNEVFDTVIPSGCTAKNTLTFGDNKAFTSTIYYGTGDNCMAGVPLGGTYEYNSDERKLAIAVAGEEPINYDVLVLTKEEMILRLADEGEDINMDDIPEIYTIHLKR